MTNGLPLVVRELLLRGTVDMLREMTIRQSMRSDFDLAVRAHLENFDRRMELAQALVNCGLAILAGGLKVEPDPPAARFDKTRRLIAKKKRKLPRGLSQAEKAAITPEGDPIAQG